MESNTVLVPFGVTLEVRDSCLCLFVQRAARALARRFDEALRPVGLTNSQFSLMMALNRPDPARMRPVADLLGLDRTTLTAALKPLQRRGLVRVAFDPEDRRTRLLSLTDPGRRVLADAVPIWRRVHGEIESVIDDPDSLRKGLGSLAGV